MVDVSVETIGVFARVLSWGSYANLLQKYIKLAREKHDMEKLMLRVVIVVLDNFHFAETAAPLAPGEEADDDDDAPAGPVMPENVFGALVHKVNTREEE